MISVRFTVISQKHNKDEHNKDEHNNREFTWMR